MATTGLMGGRQLDFSDYGQTTQEADQSVEVPGSDGAGCGL